MRAICICLPEDPASLEKARAHFAERDVEVEFFWGIHAHVAGLATSHEYEVDHPGTGYRIGEKPTGIWLSHYMLWNALLRLPDPYFLILETDAKMAPDFKERFAQAMRDAPGDFDLLYPGHCCLAGSPHQHVRGEIYASKGLMCTHAYVVKRGALPTLLTMRKIWAPIDIQLKLECFPRLNVYAIVPRIVDQFDTNIPE